MASGQTVNLHLIGKQGSGKSATGNSIIEKKVFRCKSADSPDKATLPVTQGQHGNFTLCVWDWPGTDGTQDKSKTIAKELRKINQDLHHNIHLFGWVIRYGELCGQEDTEFLHFLISELGEDYLGNRTIIIVTYKDNFDRDVEEIQLTFDEWKDQQKGFFKNLLKMCNNRIFSFDNISRPSDQRNSLLNLIWTLASNLHKKGTSYQPSIETYTLSTDWQYPSKMSKVCETDHHPLSSADDRSKSQPHMHWPTSEECKDWKTLLKSDIDSLIHILTEATGGEKICALQSLLRKVQSRQDTVGKEIRCALGREIERKIKDCEFVNGQDQNTCMYLRQLEEEI
ncbi:immune-associated nucleotide-binding protein 8 [Plakobranchus ocellatus]|uniref:Immune-associated nucleotide-binding protein 8 n=1 Tax=Plakobranchus ocellatus TaxID=259542 RepID=A0AAV4BAV2_9GAST|nr:immune-associated nucleotide-binding protein 8 [Plakobranchus ocellatus]